MSENPNASAAADSDALARYLHSHQIAAASGERLFEQAAKVWKDTPQYEALARLAVEVDEDKAELDALAHRLNAGISAPKNVIAWLGSQISKVDPINPFRTPHGATGQLELEALVTAVTGKSLLWETLQLVARSDSRIDAGRMQELLDRADRQIRELKDILNASSAARFLPTEG
ncbi:hypothetical protein KIH31_03055 [Paenarthrobacter sp. DKR-5]|uniref:hypothetical protein n=1 Tax=Paenarthrobacter sp. DKR-5 TaxID=2835535 RepID=UPI001BDC28EC|nr:hypothetical protein [Paenarthrobacter sp. DKR-5]MBT1001571.1 hypothetical protein [Paenarthrobacter sp. DKR-5]